MSHGGTLNSFANSFLFTSPPGQSNLLSRPPKILNLFASSLVKKPDPFRFSGSWQSSQPGFLLSSPLMYADPKINHSQFHLKCLSEVSYRFTPQLSSRIFVLRTPAVMGLPLFTRNFFLSRLDRGGKLHLQQCSRLIPPCTFQDEKGNLFLLSDKLAIDKIGQPHR